MKSAATITPGWLAGMPAFSRTPASTGPWMVGASMVALGIVV